MALPPPCSGCCQIQLSLILSRIKDPSTESAYFDEELTRVGAQIHQLSRLQTCLLRRRNQHRSPLYTLPLELLTAISSLACTSETASWEMLGKPTAQVIVLSSVSSYWRQVVHQTPSLWNTVTLDVNEHTSEAKGALLQHFLNHTKNLGISVDLVLEVYDEDHLETQAQLYQPIADILFAPENTQNVTTLRVKNLPVEWLAKLSQLPRLHTLVLENPQNEYYTPVTLDFHTQPLRRLSLSFDDDLNIYRGSVSLPPSVQELLTCGVTPDILLEFLRQCPNLTKVMNSDSPNVIDSSFYATPLTLGHLETLTWSAGDLPDLPDANLVQNFFLPALKHLRLNEGLDDIPVSPITFCRRFSETLTSLELHYFNCWTTSNFERLFLHEMEHLEILKLTKWPLTDLVMATRVLTPSDEEFCRNELKSLPRLQSLVLKADPCAHDTDDANDDLDDRLASVLGQLPQHSNNHTDDMINPFLELLEKRRAGQLTAFRLDFPALWSREQKLIWSDRLRDKFRQAIGGRCIEVLQDGQILEWL